MGMYVSSRDHGLSCHPPKKKKKIIKVEMIELAHPKVEMIELANPKVEMIELAHPKVEMIELAHPKVKMIEMFLLLYKQRPLIVKTTK